MLHDVLSLPVPDVQLTLGSGDLLDVRSFQIREGPSELFSLQIVARSPDNDLDFDAIVAKPARFSLASTTGAKSWHGVVTDIDLVRVDPEEASATALRLVALARRLSPAG